MKTFSEEAARRMRVAQLEHELRMLHERAARGRVVGRWLVVIAVSGWAVLAAVLLVTRP